MNVFSLIENEAVERCCPLWSEWVLHKHVKKHVFFLSWIKHFYFNPERFFILPSWNEHHCLLWSEWVRKKLEKINQQQKNNMTKKHLYINPEFLFYRRWMFVAVVEKIVFSFMNIFFFHHDKNTFILILNFFLYMNAFSLIESEASWERKEIILQNIYPSFSSRKPF